MIYQAMTALEVFEIPGILGFPAGIHVFSTKIYAIVRSATFLPVYGQANALAMVYLFIAVVTTFFYTRLISRVRAFHDHHRQRVSAAPARIGSVALSGPGFGLLYLFLAIVLPFLAFAYASFLAFLQPPSLAAFKGFTLKNYRFLLQYGEIASALKNTGIMVVVTATATVALSFFVSLVIVRSKFWGRKLLDQLAFMPHAIPGIVLGIAFFWVFLKIDFLPIYGTVWAISIGFTVSFLSYGTRSMSASLLQVHKELEEAAYVSGARALAHDAARFFAVDDADLCRHLDLGGVTRRAHRRPAADSLRRTAESSAGDSDLEHVGRRLRSSGRGDRHAADVDAFAFNFVGSLYRIPAPHGSNRRRYDSH